MPTIIDKGIEVKALFDSQIFCYDFDYDEWPGTHSNQEKVLRPYNESLYSLRRHYRTVFFEEEFADMENDESSNQVSSDKIYKIKYTIILLPLIGQHVENENGEKTIKNEDVSFLGKCTDSDELSMFECNSLNEMIEFKWERFGFQHHLVGFLVHAFQMILVIIYVQWIYLDNILWESDNYKDGDEPKYKENPYALGLLVGIFYPFVYECIQAYNIGLADYATDLGNYFDMLYILSSVAMSLIHLVIDPFQFVSKVVMIVSIMLSIIRTFKMMKIFSDFSPIVTMLSNVVYDLRIFLFFYLILTALFSILIGVLGIGNMNVNTLFSDEFKGEAEYPGVEFKHVGLLIGNFLETLRISTGDFTVIDASIYLTDAENIIFWLCWTIIVGVTCIIFLNFIIAEASASYENVAGSLSQFIQSEKAALIAESEDMMPNFMKSKERYPKFIIIRQTDN